MRVRSQSVLWQITIALLCALGAGFSGDLFSHHGPSHHGARHSRGSGHRNPRSFGRDGYGDHSTEVEVLHEESNALTDVAPGDHPQPAVVADKPAILPVLQFLAWATLVPEPTPGFFALPIRAGRAPPASL